MQGGGLLPPKQKARVKKAAGDGHPPSEEYVSTLLRFAQTDFAVSLALISIVCYNTSE